MLFNSPTFIFGFLPIFYAVYLFLLRRSLHSLSLLCILVASLLFYAWWNPHYLPLLLTSMAANYVAGVILLRWRKHRSLVLLAGITFNLVLLVYFKYIGFIMDNVATLSGMEWHIEEIVLPLAISFFTFQQIAFLADSYQGKVTHVSPLEYAVFVSFFPQLIAGPIVHHSQMMPQFATQKQQITCGIQAVAISLFTFGLFKKTVIADDLAPIANFVFTQAEIQAPLSAAEAFLGALAYTLQLYFDFSGYSEMALGLALFIGIRLPINFLSPYKSASIIEFWRRWHITLSRFLRDYVYIPLGGNRKGQARRYINLMITMLLGGLWHGAGWTFVLWGGYHGLLLMLNHGWNRVRTLLRLPTIPRPIAIVFTFILIMGGWILFRAESIAGASHIIQSILIPDTFGLDYQTIRTLLKTGGNSSGYMLLLFLGGLITIFFLPSVVNWHLGAEGRVGFRPSRWMLAVVVLMWGIILYKAGGTNEFLYFQF